MINSYLVIKEDGKTLQHFLPLLFGMFFIVISIFGLYYDYHYIIKIIFYFLNIIPLAMLYIFIFTNLIADNNEKEHDFIIVLGCKINNNGHPMRVLRNRLNIAIDIFNKAKNKPYIIVCGGKGIDEPITEAESMKEYLIKHNVEEKHILLENKSMSTYENLFNAKGIMSKLKKKYTAICVSSKYHLLRVNEIAKSLDIKLELIGSKTTLVYYPCALCRETIAFLLNNILICIAYFIFVILLYLCVNIIL